MVSGLPDRPLKLEEVFALAASDPINFALPAAPESSKFDDTGERNIYDIVLFINSTIIATAYVKETQEWVVVGRKESVEGEPVFEDVLHELYEYRGYQSEVEETRKIILEEAARVLGTDIASLKDQTG